MRWSSRNRSTKTARSFTEPPDPHLSDGIMRTRKPFRLFGPYRRSPRAAQWRVAMAVGIDEEEYIASIFRKLPETLFTALRVFRPFLFHWIAKSR